MSTFTQHFDLEVTEVRLHPDNTLDDPMWVLDGVLTSYVPDEWSSGRVSNFSWGFHVVVGVRDEKVYPILFQSADHMGTYSHFFRALIWERLLQTSLRGLGWKRT